jgi:hypothetical protein
MDKKWLLPLSTISALLLLACSAGTKLVTDRVASACSDAKLTPEELANCGPHTYELEEKLTSNCLAMDEDRGVKQIVTWFSGDTMTTSIHDWQFTRIAANEYESVRGRSSPSSNIPRHVNMIRLTTDGFTENYAYEGPQGNLIDCWLDTYTITR